MTPLGKRTLQVIAQATSRPDPEASPIIQPGHPDWDQAIADLNRIRDDFCGMTPKQWRHQYLANPAPLSTTASTSTMALAPKTHKTPPPMAAPVSAAPSWVATTLAWLKQEHPMYATSVAKTPQARLQKSLSRMGWQLATRESVGGMRGPEYEQTLEHAVADWDQAKHDNMRLFLTAGGLEADRKKLGVPNPTVAPAAVDPDPDPEVIKSLRPKQQMSPDHEIEALLEIEEREANPDSGSW